MACFHPVTAWKPLDGGPRYTLNRLKGYQDLPTVQFPCSQCIGCRKEYTRQWAVRSYHEAKMHKACSFITLTYDDKSLPAHGTLVKKHWQEFANLLRRKLGPFRYMHCGEYGEARNRPHYHASIFGINFEADRIPTGTNKQGDQLYESKTLTDLWGKGNCILGNLTYETARYVAGYVFKKLNGEQIKHYDIYDPQTGEVFGQRIPEYTTMSRNPGIGKKWIDEFMSDVYPHDEVIINGSRQKPPKFYDTQYELINPQGMALIKAKRRRLADTHSEDQTPDRRHAREHFQNLTVKKALKRTI